MFDYPSYLQTHKNGKLKEVADKLYNSLSSCCICPRECKVNRLEGKLGFCKTGAVAKVFSFMAHHGEEPPVSGDKGSGTIFFSNCNMGCVYCQNYEFSQMCKGKENEISELAGVMIKLQNLGCHNINLVTPTHILPQILLSLIIAIEKGLRIPLVYNTSGYESASIIKLLDGIADIYLTDMRYADKDTSLLLSKAFDYPKRNQEAVKEMHRQVGVAQIGEDGIIKRGLIIRHLVLPNNLSGTEEISRFIAKEISGDTYISLMSQYLPYYQAKDHPQISRRLKEEEYAQAKEMLKNNKLLNGWVQESYGAERFAGVNIKPS